MSMFLSRSRSALVGAATLAAFVGTAARAPAQILAAEWHGDPSTSGSLGTRVVNAGDVDGDGVDDLLVGDIVHDTALIDVGQVCVYSGKTFALIRAHVGAQAYEYFGRSMDTVGDLDLDGCADYVIGAHEHDTTLANAGAAFVYSGKNGGALWSVFGSAQDESLGSCVSGIADMDGDGRDEVLVGSRGAGDVRIYDSDGNLYLTLQHQGFEFGTASARIADVDGDGHDDFMVSRPAWTPPQQPERGEVRVYSGTSATFLFGFKGDQPNDRLGEWQIDDLGDIDGDGVVDLFAGAPQSDTNGVDAGYLRIVSGTDGSTLRTTYGDTPGAYMALNMDRVGDVDHDGVGDYAVAAPFGGVNGLGVVRLCSGRFGTQLYEYAGSADAVGSNYIFGSGLASYDANGDGLLDLAISDYGYDSYVQGAIVGGVWVYSGCPASSENYGTGWPGKLGIPNFVALDDPGVGESLSLQIDNSSGATTFALMFLGYSQASIPTGKGGTLLVSAAQTIPLSLPAGGLVLAGALPNDPALYLFEIDLQVLELDPLASKGVSFTPGLELDCGFDF